MTTSRRVTPRTSQAREVMRIVREDCDKTSLASGQPGSEVRHHRALRKFSNLGDGSRSTSHKDRVIGGAKRKVVRGRCRIESGRLLARAWTHDAALPLAGWRQRDIIVDQGCRFSEPRITAWT